VSKLQTRRINANRKRSVVEETNHKIKRDIDELEQAMKSKKNQNQQKIIFNDYSTSFKQQEDDNEDECEQDCDYNKKAIEKDESPKSDEM